MNFIIPATVSQPLPQDGWGGATTLEIVGEGIFNAILTTKIAELPGNLASETLAKDLRFFLLWMIN